MSTETSDEIKKSPQSAAYTTTSTNNPNLFGLGSTNMVNLKHLVNLALSSSPKSGVVNFNLLKVFLLELLKALNLQNHEFKFDPNGVDASSIAGLLDGEITQSDLDAANQSLLVNFLN